MTSKCSRESRMSRGSPRGLLFFGHLNKITVTVTVTVKSICRPDPIITLSLFNQYGTGCLGYRYNLLNHEAKKFVNARNKSFFSPVCKISPLVTVTVTVTVTVNKLKLQAFYSSTILDYKYITVILQ